MPSAARHESSAELQAGTSGGREAGKSTLGDGVQAVSVCEFMGVSELYKLMCLHACFVLTAF